MIHAICDFCGKDCDRTATLLSMTPFQNFARYHTDNEPYGNREKIRIEEVKFMSKIRIGDIAEIKVQVVDYNDGDEKMKLRITGYAENKVTPVDRYIWVNYADVNFLN